jgi:plasmid stability protein
MNETVADPTRALTVQLLEWLAKRPRTYVEIIDAWRTTCPRLSIWEDACIDGLIDRDEGREPLYFPSKKGHSFLRSDLEPEMVRELRSQAAAQGISVEEANRRLLRAALFGDKPGPKDNFNAYLQSVPPGDDIEFPRSPDLSRPAEL